MKLRTVGVAVGGIAAAYAAERLLVGRARARLDPAVVASFAFPDDAVHHDLPMADGGSVHVVERGAGRPLILLHGITLSSLTWHYQLRDLGDDHRVVAVDHRGHGASPPASGEPGLRGLADDLAEVLVGLDLRDAVIVGHSMGGMVTLRLALDHPGVVAERVAGMVLMSTSGGPVVRLAAWDVVADLVTPPAAKALALGDRVPGGVFRPNDLSYLVFRLGMGRDASAEHVELNRLMTSATPVAAWSGLMAEVARFDVVDRLREIDVPARVLVGTRDLLTPPSSARQLVRELPRAEPLVAFPGAGHMLMLERRDEVSRRLAAFAAELP